MTERRFRRLGLLEELEACYVVSDHRSGVKTNLFFLDFDTICMVKYGSFD
jgi:hypothetical protein